MDVGPAELIIVLVVVLVLFGGAKLPQLARSLGQAQTEFKRGRQEGLRSGDPETEPEPAAEPASDTPAPQPTTDADTPGDTEASAAEPTDADGDTST